MSGENPFAGAGLASDGSGPTEIIAPYKHLFKDLAGPGDQRPTALQIVKDEGLEGKWDEKAVIVTGGSSGIGVETVRAMQATGARVFAGARNKEKGQKVIDEINASTKGGKPVELLLMDNESLDSVRAAAKDFLSRSDRLNVLITNAGIMACPEARTKDGFESQFAVCHLAHFLLFQLLRPLLEKSAKSDFASRVVALSSMGHRAGGVNFDNINFEGEYNDWKAYGQAKTANVYFASYIDRHFSSKGIHAMALHPGGIATGLQVHLDPEIVKGWGTDPAIKKGMKSAEQGAATSVWAATARGLEGKGRLYLEDCQTCGPQPENPGNFDIGYAPWGFNMAAEDKLWALSNKLVGFQED